MAPAWMPGKGLAAGMLLWPVARVLKFCEGNTAQKARKQGRGRPPGDAIPKQGNRTLAAAKNVNPRQWLRNPRLHKPAATAQKSGHQAA